MMSLYAGAVSHRVKCKMLQQRASAKLECNRNGTSVFRIENCRWQIVISTAFKGTVS